MTVYECVRVRVCACVCVCVCMRVCVRVWGGVKRAHRSKSTATTVAPMASRVGSGPMAEPAPSTTNTCRSAVVGRWWWVGGGGSVVVVGRGMRVCVCVCHTCVYATCV